jgi:hypothetical protein
VSDPLDQPATPTEPDVPATPDPSGMPAGAWSSPSKVQSSSAGGSPSPASGPPVGPGHRPSGSITPTVPTYRGEPLDSERGPGLGCFWFQVILLGVLLVITPLTVIWAWDPAVSAGLLILTLLLLLFAGNTVIFLLRLVAADRRTRRRPLNESARKTVGQLEEEAAARPAETSTDPDETPR